MGHQGKWELASPCSYHKHFPSICYLVWNLQPQAFKPLMLLPDEICWTCFPSQPSFPFYPRVECFSGSLALCLCFLQILLPLWPGSIPLCYLWLHLEHKFVGERRWFLSPHNHLLLSALERTWKNSYLSTVQVSP